jgi:hypothetical protein
MALAKQFYSSFKSYNSWEYYLEIWVEGYSGSASEITLGEGGPVITYGTDEQDRFSPILSSKLELPFMVTNTTQDGFINNIREQFNERDVYIHLYRANSSDYSSVAPLWSGYVLMDLSAAPDLYYPYAVKLTAVDGLALLKEIDFVQSGTAGSYSDSDMYSSNGRLTYWIKEILLKTGASTTSEGSTQDYKFTTAINWFNSVMPTITQSTDPFYQTKCGTKMFFSKDSNDNFTIVNSYDVLLNLLKHWGARIIYWKHVFYIVQIQEYNTAESGTYANPDNINTRTYTKTGAFDSSSDNLGDSYWTRYNLLIDDVTGGIQKLAGSQFNYLPQLKRAQANFLDYGNKNYFGGLPFDITTGQTDVILQDTFEDVSSDGAMLLVLPLDVTIAQQYNGTLSMNLTFRLYITDGATTYYLRYDPTNTPKFYWEDSSTANLNFKKTIWRSQLDNIVGTQTKVGFHQLIEFKDSGGSALNLSGEWKAYTDIDSWGGSGGSFYFYASVGGFNQNNVQVFTPSLTTVYWTNTLNSNYQTPLNPVVIGTTNQQTTGMTGTQFNFISNNIVSYQSSFNINPFEGKLLIVNTTSSGAVYGSQVMVTPQTTTSDVEVVDFGDLIWGDTLLASSEGSLKVWNGSAFVKSNVTGTWGLGSTSGTNSFTEMLLSEYLYGQTKVVESPSMRLVIGEINKNQNDGSGSRPNYVNPIGRLKGYSATGTTPYYIFKSGSFHLLRDEIDYEGYQIIRDTQTVTKTHDIIIGPDVLQDKTNKIGQKTPSSNTLAAKLTQNSYITTISSTKSAYGNDIAVNGIFSSDSNWTKGTGWSIASNKASFSPTGSTSEIKQDILTNALTYKIVVTVSVSAGGLSVKAGSSGSATVLSASGTYEIFSTCSGSTDVIFEASAAFEGYIEKVVVQQQVPITSININAIGTAVFKTNDVLNIANFDGNEINEFTVSSDQGASDTSISVTSKLITEDILEGSIVLVNQNDLAAQYQNKTKGTVAGFTIDADGIAKGGVEITGWLDSDTMSGATANNVPTAESVKAYVDTQVGSADTLAEVLANGNTTGGTDIVVNDNDKINFGAGNDLQIFHDSNNSYIKDEGTGDLYIQGSDDIYITAANGEKFITCNTNDSVEIRYDNSIKLSTTNTGISITGGGVFTDQVTIPATPVAATDAASKSYVDAQVGTADTLQEVTDLGNTTTNSVMIGSSSSPSSTLEIEKTTTTGSGFKLRRNLSSGSMDSPLVNIVEDSQYADETTLRIQNDGSGDIINVFDATTEVFTILDGGNVLISQNLLINTTTDSGNATLQVAGNIEIGNGFKYYTGFGTSNFLTYNVWNINSGSFSYINQAGSGDFGIKTASTERLRVTNGGNLLIGTTTDNGDKLQIGVANSAPSFATDPNVATTIASTTNGDEVALQLFVNDGTNNIRSKYFVDDTELLAGFDVTYSSGLNGFAFKMIGSEKMRLSTNGNLLIGTTSSSLGGLLIVSGSSYFGNSTTNTVRIEAGLIRMQDNSDSGRSLEIQATDIIVGQNNSFTYGYSGGGQLVSVGTAASNILLDVGGYNSVDSTFQIALDSTGNHPVINLFNKNTNASTLYADSKTATVALGTSSPDTAYALDIAGKAQIQSVLELDDVLTLNAISTPSDPAAGKSSIYMDSSDGAIKVKINVGGTVVTRTIASFE